MPIAAGSVSASLNLPHVVFYATFSGIYPYYYQRWRMTTTDKQEIDADWFKDKLSEQRKSLRGLARHMEMDPSAVSRMLSGQRRMQVQEANQIALFLGTTVSEVLNHAGMAVDLDGQPTRILLAATIDERGYLHRLMDPKPLPQSVIERAQAAIGKSNRKVIAAQVRASSGPLAVMDDAVVLFNHTDIVEPAAIGSLSICRNREGDQVMVKLERSRKTGEATVRCAADVQKEAQLVTATPVLAIIP